MTTMTIDTKNMEEVGDNVQATIVEGHIVFVADLDVNLGDTSRGKAFSIANTHGFKPLELIDGARFNLWVGKEKPKDEDEKVVKKPVAKKSKK